MNDVTRNLDPDVASGFGHEWTTFRQSGNEFLAIDREAIFQSYFQIFPWDELPPNATASMSAAAAGAGR